MSTIFSKYRRKPVVVEAVQWRVTKTAVDDADPIIREILSTGGSAWFDMEFGKPCLWIQTLEGKFAASPGDYICRGVKGEYWPVKPDVFEYTNEPIEA